MKWNLSRRGGLLLSSGYLAVFTVLLLALDAGAYWIVKWFLTVSHGLDGMRDGALLLASIYSCSVPAWLAVVALWRLLWCIAGGELFSALTLRCLRTTARCCFAVCVLTLASTLYYLPMALLSLAAGFMGALVSILRSIFETALTMQDELDLTV